MAHMTHHNAQWHTQLITMHKKSLTTHNLYTHLYDWEDVNEIKPLYLVRLDAVRTLHLGQHTHYLLRKSTAKRRDSVVTVT
jgi:hypothetical protein